MVHGYGLLWQSGCMLGGRSSSRYSPGRTTVVGADERNT